MAWNPEDLHHDVMGRAVRGFNKGGIVEPTMSTYFGATKEALAKAITEFENPKEYIKAWEKGENKGWNNPGNIKWGSGIAKQFHGDDWDKEGIAWKYGKEKEDGTKSKFMLFDSIADGQKALLEQLERYAIGQSLSSKKTEGKQLMAWDNKSQDWTVDEFIKTYAPTGIENNPQQTGNYKAYITSILKREIAKSKKDQALAKNQALKVS